MQSVYDKGELCLTCESLCFMVLVNSDWRHLQLVRHMQVKASALHAITLSEHIFSAPLQKGQECFQSSQL